MVYFEIVTGSVEHHIGFKPGKIILQIVKPLVAVYPMRPKFVLQFKITQPHTLKGEQQFKTKHKQQPYCCCQQRCTKSPTPCAFCHRIIFRPEDNVVSDTGYIS
jgi:hypothetical protein